MVRHGRREDVEVARQPGVRRRPAQGVGPAGDPPGRSSSTTTATTGSGTTTLMPARRRPARRGGAAAGRAATAALDEVRAALDDDLDTPGARGRDRRRRGRGRRRRRGRGAARRRRLSAALTHDDAEFIGSRRQPGTDASARARYASTGREHRTGRGKAQQRVRRVVLARSPSACGTFDARGLRPAARRRPGDPVPEPRLLPRLGVPDAARCRGSISFVGKAEYMDSWKTKYLFPAMGMIPIDRGGGDKSQAALDTAEARAAPRRAVRHLPRGHAQPRRHAAQGPHRARPGWR